ncbi:hypothetical protein B484DRAFT_404010 [Ochromonadaceae sp. CCMP2298]|nr:hypothetical protein B484DRAFT_404010 [Ochromonadaceae sp. CCMP2298]
MNVAIALLSILLCWLSLTEARTGDQKGEDGKPRAILHIGPDKTGSTSVQAMLASAETHFIMKGVNTYWLPLSEVHHFVWEVKDLLQGFDVTIVAVYREYLSHMISKTGEDNKMYHAAGHHQPFSKHLMAMDHIDRCRNYITTLGDWRQVFGKDTLQIVDFYGAIVAGKSVLRAVLCEVAGVLCNANEDV